MQVFLHWPLWPGPGRTADPSASVGMTIFWEWQGSFDQKQVHYASLLMNKLFIPF